MAPFCGWGSIASTLEPLRGGSLLFTTKFNYLKARTTSRRQFTFLPLSSQKFLVLNFIESTLQPLSGFEHGTPGLGIQHLNH